MKLLICTQAVDINHPILGFFHGWIEEFSRHFDEVNIICLQKGEYHLPAHVHVFSLGKEEGENKLKYIYRFYKYFGRLFFRGNIDFVFFHMGAIYNILGAPFFVLRKFFGTKFYWWKAHGHLNLAGKISLFFVDRVYTASEGSFPLQTKKKFIVGHAVETNVQYRKILAEAHVPVILFVGRVTPIKKVEILIDALSELSLRGYTCRLNIVGSAPDPIYKQKLQIQIDNLDLGGRVSFKGQRIHSDLGEEYRQADVVVNPSETGSIDKVVLEAMAYGVPVIATERTYGEILNTFGLCAKAQDAKVYADVIENVLENRAQQENLSKELRSQILLRHSLETLSNRIFLTV